MEPPRGVPLGTFGVIQLLRSFPGWNNPDLLFVTFGSDRNDFKDKSTWMYKLPSLRVSHLGFGALRELPGGGLGLSRAAEGWRNVT